MTATLATETATSHALAVEDLQLAYLVRGVPREVLRGVSFHVRPGEAYGLVGESGCGKSTTAYAALRYLPANGVIVGGRILVDGADVTRMSDRELRQFRARNASMVYQDPGSALNPSLKIGRQVSEAFAHSRPGPRRRPPERRGGAAPGPHRRSRAGDAALPAPALRRNAAARRDRHGAGVRSQAARARRADHRARRHRRGRGARPRAHVAQRDRRGDPAHRPQPRCDPLDVRSGRRDVRRQDRRGRRRHRGVRGARSTRTPSACCSASPATVLASRSGRCSRSREHCPDRHPAADVCVRRSLRARRRGVPHRRRPPEVPVGDGHFSRCHHVDRLDQIPEPTAEQSAAVSRRQGRDQDAGRVEDVSSARPRDPRPRRRSISV